MTGYADCPSPLGTVCTDPRCPLHAAGPIAEAIVRAQHAGRVAAALTLALTGQLHEATGLAAGLEALNVRPPARLATTDLDVDTAGLLAYADQLLELAERVTAYAADPETAYEAEHDLDTLAVPLHYAARDEADRLADALEELIGESYPPTRDAAR